MKHVRVLGKIIIFLYSFLPLFILLFLNNASIRDKNGIYTVKAFFQQFYLTGFLSPEGFFWSSLFMLLFLGILSIYLFDYWYIKESTGVSRKIVGKAYSKADVFGYLMGYIIPLATIDIHSYRSIVVNFLIFLIVAIFYIKDNRFFLNPILNLKGYNIFEIDGDYVYITKLKSKELKNLFARNIEVEHISIAENIFLVKKYGEED